MRIDDIIKERKFTVSFEVFPPKKDMEIDAMEELLSQLSSLKPDFISVTYGAGGSGSRNKTAEIASQVKRHGIESIAHLTCINNTRAEISGICSSLSEMGIENILALRGDIPDGRPIPGDYNYAKELIADISGDSFCIGAAAYAEGHIDCESMDDNIEYLYQKEQTGASFFITQLFFDNRLFYDFRDRATARGITAPIIPGIMPMLSRAQTERMIFTCAASLPSAIIKLLNKYADDPDGLRKAGIEYASRQMSELAEQDCGGVHIYTMNKYDVAAAGTEALNVYR